MSDTIFLSDGYNDDIQEFYIDPIETDGDLVKLRVVGSDYLFRWITKNNLEKAINTAYEKMERELYDQFERSIASEYQQAEKRQKYEQWLKEENGF